MNSSFSSSNLTSSSLLDTPTSSSWPTPSASLLSMEVPPLPTPLYEEREEETQGEAEARSEPLAANATNATNPEAKCDGKAADSKGSTDFQDEYENRDPQVATVDVPPALAWVPPENVVFSIDENFEKRLVIGEGVSSRVFRAIAKRGKLRGQRVALKVVSKAMEAADLCVAAEAQALRVLRHPGVIAYKGTFVDRESYAIATELASISLFEALKRQPSQRFSERRARRIVRGLLSTLVWLHRNRVAHRDIKLENVVFMRGDDAMRRPKLIDFADVFQARIGEERIDYLAGTTQYMAPEKFRDHAGWETMTADIWSVGVVCYEILTGGHCFSPKKDKGRLQILRNKWYFPKDAPISSSARDFVRFLLTYKSDKRPTAEECLRHPWIAMDRAAKPTMKECFM